MVWADWLFLLAMAISVLTGFMRGFLREAVALIAWILGAYLAFQYSPHVEVLLEPYIETLEFRYAIAFMSILIIFLILGGLLGLILSRIVAKIGLLGLDKTLGIFFGIARGLLVVIVFIMIASFTAIPKSDWWDKSWFISQLKEPADRILIWIKDSGMLPKETWDMQLSPNGTLVPKPGSQSSGANKPAQAPQLPTVPQKGAGNNITSSPSA